MAAKESTPAGDGGTKYEALQVVSDRITDLFSVEPLRVASSLFAKMMIPQGVLEAMLLGGRDSREKATQLMGAVLTHVKNFPGNFETFMEVLKEQSCLNDLVEVIEHQLEMLQRKKYQKKAEDICFESRSPEERQQSPESFSTFPYLKTPTLTPEERKRLLARLSVESDNMCRKWALLTDRCRGHLIGKKITTEDLKMLIKCPFNKLLKLFKRGMKMNHLFSKLYDHLSFFDHEFLRLIIERHCTELIPDMNTYESDLKAYCRNHRVVEVPAEELKRRRANENSLFVKCDMNFESATLEDISKLEVRLSQLLGVDLFLLRVDDGCTELVFEAMCPVFPLTKSQKEQLAEMGVLKLYSLHYKSDKAPPSPDIHILRPSKYVDSGVDISESESESLWKEDISKEVVKMKNIHEETEINILEEELEITRTKTFKQSTSLFRIQAEFKRSRRTSRAPAPSMKLSVQDLTELIMMYRPYAHRWREIGQNLGFTNEELNIIEGNPSVSYFGAMLSERASEDALGSEELKDLINYAVAVE